MAWKLKNLFARKPPPARFGAENIFERGNAHVSQQQWQAALDCYREAALANPNHAEAHAFLGNVLRQLGQPDRALMSYERAIAIRPDYPEALYNRGSLLLQVQQFRGALQSFELALLANPSFAEAYFQCGIIRQQCGESNDAEVSYRRAIALKPAYADAHFNLGILQSDTGNANAALLSFDHTLALAPSHAGAHAARGIALLALRRADEAVAAFTMAVELKPNSARVFGNLAQAQFKLELIQAARASYEKAVLLDPNDAEIHFNRGNFLSEIRDWDSAMTSYVAAIASQPNYAEAYCNLGLAQQESAQSDAALQSYARALAIDSQISMAHNNRGNLFRSRRLFAPALLDYRRAIELEPDLAEAHYNMGQIMLLEGDLAAGWPEYEWRTRIEEARTVCGRELPHPVWQGQDSLVGKTIFIHAEQGLGDTIQFCRYARMVASLGARVTLEVQPALGDLLAGLAGVERLLLFGANVPEADYHCSLLSLPAAFETTLETIPRAVPYLSADPGKIARWRTLLKTRTRPRVGLAWSGNPQNRNDHNRSISLGTWMPHLPIEYDYICLQKWISAADRQIMESSKKFIDVESSNDNFTDTAALLETLDLVISVDTSLAHLSGAMGKKTWILLPFLPDWRWMVDRNDTPWYPSATLYRQPAPGDWDSVLDEIKEDLLGRLSS